MTQPTPAAAPAAPAAAAPTPAAPAAPAPASAAPAAPDSLLPENPPAAAPDPAAPVAPAEPAAPATDPNSPDAWVLDEGVQGQGKPPEWFKRDKYASVAEQAKAYSELEKRFGAFTGAPKDGTYDLTMPEGAGVELVADHPLLGTFKTWAKDNHLSQKGFTELMGFLGQYEAQHFVDMGEVKKTLGENADARITAVAQWGRANLGDEGYATLREALSGKQAAAVLQVIEKAISKTKQVSLPRPGADVAPVGADAHKAIDDMMAVKDEKGGLKFFTDPKYRAEVEAKRAALYAQ